MCVTFVFYFLRVKRYKELDADNKRLSQQISVSSYIIIDNELLGYESESGCDAYRLSV